jgi:hypothetical protein
MPEPSGVFVREIALMREAEATATVSAYAARKRAGTPYSASLYFSR